MEERPSSIEIPQHALQDPEVHLRGKVDATVFPHLVDHHLGPLDVSPDGQRSPECDVREQRREELAQLSDRVCLAGMVDRSFQCVRHRTGPGDHVLGQGVQAPRLTQTQIVSERLEQRERCFHRELGFRHRFLRVGAHPEARPADGRPQLDLTISSLESDRDRLSEDRLRPDQVPSEIERCTEIRQHP